MPADMEHAYPQAEKVGECAVAYGGLTKREYYAAQAMAGLLAHPSCQPVGRGFDFTTRAVADEAVRMADALIEELAK